MQFHKKKRNHLRVKQYKLAHLVCVVGTPKRDKAEAKTSSEGGLVSSFSLFALSLKALQGARKISSRLSKIEILLRV